MFGRLPTASVLMVVSVSTTFSAPELGAPSSSASSSLSFPSGAYHLECQSTIAHSSFVEDRSFKLIIVDSVMNLFRQDYSGRGELSERQQVTCLGSGPIRLITKKLNQYLARLQKLAEEFNVAIVMTNQVQADPGVSDAPHPASELMSRRLRCESAKGGKNSQLTHQIRCCGHCEARWRCVLLRVVEYQLISRSCFGARVAQPI